MRAPLLSSAGWYLSRPFGLAAALAVLTIAFCASMLATGDSVGPGDWQYYTFLWETSKHSLLDYGQLPLWNPYEIGGNIYVAHPNTQFLAPLHLLLLPLDSAVALKINSAAHLFLGLLGMVTLATRVFRMSLPAALAAAMVWAFASFFGWRLQSQLEKVSLLYLPWALYFFILSLERLRHVFSTALVLTVVVLEGGAAYALIFILLFLGVFALVQAAETRSWRPIGVLLLIGAALLCLSAVRLFPIFDFLARQRRVVGPDDAIGLSLLPQIFFSRRTMPNYLWDPGPYRYGFWGEYAHYLGGVAVLFLAALALRLRRYWRWFLIGGVFLALALGDHGPWSPFGLLRRLPIFEGLRVPTRYAVLFVFCVAVVVGLFCDEAWRYLRSRARPVAAAFFAVAALVALADYAIFNQTMLHGAFRSAPLSSFQCERKDFVQLIHTSSYAYEAPRCNFGVLNFYEEMKISASPRLRSHPAPEVYLQRPELGQARRVAWSPQQLRIRADVREAGAVVLVNMNHDRHWNARGATVVNHEGLLGLVLDHAGESSIALSYEPAPFFAGAVVSLASLAVGLWLFLHARRREERRLSGNLLKNDAALIERAKKNLARILKT